MRAPDGIEDRYADQTGQERCVPPETLHALSEVLGTAHDDDHRVLAPVFVTRADRPLAVAVRLPAAAHRLQWEIVEEDGTRHRGDATRAATDSGRLAIPLRLGLGYHRLSLRWTGGTPGEAETALIVVPQRGFMPRCLTDGRGAWGLAAQLYALRSPRNWGIGDFTDLVGLIEQAAPAGAAAVGLNPLHASFPDDPERASPYSPSSRSFLNTLYLDVEAIEDFAESSPARHLAASAEFRRVLSRLRRASLVDYTAVAARKRRVFELLYDSFRSRHLVAGTARGQMFRVFQRKGGTTLRRFATFQALRELRGAADPAQRSWRQWPDELRVPTSSAVERFAEAHLPRLEFHEYLQWQAQLQLGRAASSAREREMGIGLYQDLAVGFDPDGADAWAQQDVLVDGWSIGAPPDDYNLKGQNWGLQPSNPRRLRDIAYRPFIEMLRANMRHAGALRIDHVLGLKRMFWVPNGAPATAGAYVRYPFDDLLSLVALESVRNECLVVGEDLGTVPAGFRQSLNARGILSYEVLYFARDQGRFRPPKAWPKDALAVVSTHDLPTFTGYWTDRDIRLKSRLSLYPDRTRAAQDRIERAQARRALTSALRAAGIAATGRPPPLEPVHRFLARTRSRLVMAQLEDLVGATDGVNVPGTVNEHPNWRRKLPETIDEMFEAPKARRLLAALREERPRPQTRTAVPDATYRLQLHKGFNFRAAESVLPYLQALGVSHVYLSPILEAQPGSTHGYDTTSFERLNPELGGAPGFAAFSAALRRLGLRAIVDFVPNHMGVGGHRNAWWLDVLEWGQHSAYADVFDIDWTPAATPELRGKVLVPLLGTTIETALARGELKLKFDSAGGSFAVWYHDNCFPIRPSHYADVLAAGLQARGGGLAPGLRAAIARLVRGVAQHQASRGHADALKAALARLAAKPAALAFLAQCAAALERDAAAFKQLLNRQAYSLTAWQRAADAINYRRFFDINQLAALRMERPAVFALCHRFMGQLIAEDCVHGLRLDHVDGLADPAAYGRRLHAFARRQTREPFYIAVEKILARDEELRPDWGVDGTTGYEFANLVSGVLVDPTGAGPLDKVYAKFIGGRVDFDLLLRAAKLQVIETLFGAELNALTVQLCRIAEQTTPALAHPERLRPVLRDIAAAFAVYRTYVSARGTSADDRRVIGRAVAAARRANPVRDTTAFAFAQRALTTDLAMRRPARLRTDILRFAMRFQQFTSPIMAKSLEDTAFYRYSRLLALNEVGGDPRHFGVPLAEFHHRVARQRKSWPHTMLATATHDTKRGEDARARLDVLSEIPDLWSRHVARWRDLNKRHKAIVDGAPAPSANDEYVIYQTLVGAWPHELAGRPRDETRLRGFAERVQAFVLKAIREAKQQTSWHAPNLDYEAACRAFVDSCLLSDAGNRFREDLVQLDAIVARLGALNSLSQTVLKLTLPGVPDIYQGCELWDLSLVDPDNRRPVDFARHAQLLRDWSALDRMDQTAALPALRTDWRSGRIKQHVVASLLAARRRDPALFSDGTYEALPVSGAAARHVVAFARRYRDRTMLVAVGRFFTGLTPQDDDLCPARDVWRATVIKAHGAVPTWRNTLSGAVLIPDSRQGLAADELFRDLPAAVLISAA